MAIHNYAQVLQCIIYLLSFIFSLIYFVPMCMNVVDFEGKCLLFTTGVFNESDGRIFEPNWASFSNCGLTLFNGFVITAISSIQFGFSLINFYRGYTGSIISTFWQALIAFIVFSDTLINSVLVIVGFNKWCNTLSQNFESCEDAADSNVLIISGSDHIKPERFYLQMGTVSFGLLSSLVAWFILLVVSSLSFYEYHEKENLIISMARERRRYETIDEE